MRRVAEWAAGWVLVLGTVVPAAADDGIVEKKTFSMPSYTTQNGGKEIPDDGGHLDGVLAVAKVGETIRKFLTE